MTGDKVVLTCARRGVLGPDMAGPAACLRRVRPETAA